MNDLPFGFRTPPHNIEAEQAFLGAVLINNEALVRSAAYVSADDFYEPVHRRIFAATKRLIDAGRIADHVTLQRAFDEDEALRELDGAKYLAGLARAAETILNAQDYARLIRELARKRELIALGEAMVNLAYDPAAPESSGEIATAYGSRIERIASGSAANVVRPVSEFVEEMVERLEEGVKVISTGFPSLDRSMGGGLRVGSLYGIEAPSKSFKTGVLAGIFEQSCLEHSTRGLLISLEMHPGDVFQRTMAGRAGLGFQGVEKLEKRTARRKKVDEFCYLAEARKKSAFAAHLPTVEIDQLLGIMAETVLDHAVDLIAIDYWQLIRGQERGESAADHLEDVAYRIAGFAAKHQVAIIMASQTNRDGQSLRSDGLRRACAWLGQLHKVEIPTACSGLSDTGLWVEVPLNRYGVADAIGSKFAPAFKIETGPVLREWR